MHACFCRAWDTQATTHGTACNCRMLHLKTVEWHRVCNLQFLFFFGRCEEVCNDNVAIHMSTERMRGPGIPVPAEEQELIAVIVHKGAPLHPNEAAGRTRGP